MILQLREKGSLSMLFSRALWLVPLRAQCIWKSREPSGKVRYLACSDCLICVGYSIWSLQNPTLQLSALSIVISVATYFKFGILGVVFFFLQSFFAFGLLEIVNYIEHYGLQRKKAEGIIYTLAGTDELDGKGYEIVNPQHSWNSDSRLTNFFLFKLQRHSDHHANAHRRSVAFYALCLCW